MARITQSFIYNMFDTYIEQFVIENRWCLLSNVQDNYQFEECWNDVYQRFVVGSEEDPNERFKDKLRLQFNGAQIDSKRYFSHVHWLWIFAASDCSATAKNELIFDECGTVSKLFKFSKRVGIGSANPRFLKFKEIKFIIILLGLIEDFKKKTSQNSIDSIKSFIIETILKNEYDDPDIKKNLPLKNALLHLCSPDYFEAIFSSNHKTQIARAFKDLIEFQDIDEEQGNEENPTPASLAEKDSDCSFAIFGKGNLDSTDYKLYQIRKELNLGNESFYGDQIRPLWDCVKDSTFNEISSLKFKKAIILYGPPGTSKSFSAQRIALSLFCQIDKKQIRDIGTALITWNKRIHKLQLHANYTYEDFIWGYQLSSDGQGGSMTIPKKGYLLRLIEEIEKETKIAGEEQPHVLILDEINRVDLSRLFGEFFSAIENRQTSVELPVSFDGKSSDTGICSAIKVPEKLYIIGTMNEIDFSLERVDFALRRRFVWWFKGFDKETLRVILLQKWENFNKVPDEDTIEKYLESCVGLNNMIDTTPELGEQYQIGHTLFAEVADVLCNMDKKDFGKAKEILWNISIYPMLDSFLGNCSKDLKERFLPVYGIEQKDKKKSVSKSSFTYCFFKHEIESSKTEQNGKN